MDENSSRIIREVLSNKSIIEVRHKKYKDSEWATGTISYDGNYSGWALFKSGRYTWNISPTAGDTFAVEKINGDNYLILEFDTFVSVNQNF